MMLTPSTRGPSASDQGAMQMFEAIYDTPVRQDYRTGGVSPGMATKWEVTPTKIVFDLKPGLKCSDGTNLHPTDVAKGMQRLADPKTGSIDTGRLFGAGGVKQIVAEDAKNKLSVEVTDPHSDLIDGMSTAFIVCPKGLADTKALATKPQGSGPYKITTLKRGDEYVLEAWGSPTLLFETGATNIAAIQGQGFKRLEAKDKPIQGKAFEADSLTFNHRPGTPIADERLRRVVAQAIDAGSYTKAASFGVGEPVWIRSSLRTWIAIPIPMARLGRSTTWSKPRLI